MVGEIKVVVVGDSSVGKSSLINTHCPPITGVDDASIASVCGVAFALCDTFGAQRFRTLTSGFYRHARGVLIVFDVTDRETYNNVPQWMSEVRLRTHVSMPVVVVANKCDLGAKRQVTRSEAMHLCSEMEVGYTETSAVLYTSQTDVSGALAHALRLLLERMPQTPATAAFDDRKRRRHRSLALRPGAKFRLPAAVDVSLSVAKKKKNKRRGLLAVLRCKDRVDVEAATEPPIYELNSICRDQPQNRQKN